MTLRAATIRTATIAWLMLGAFALSACAMIDENARLDDRVLDSPDMPSSATSNHPRGSAGSNR